MTEVPAHQPMSCAPAPGHAVILQPVPANGRKNHSHDNLPFTRGVGIKTFGPLSVRSLAGQDYTTSTVRDCTLASSLAVRGGKECHAP